MSILGNNCHLPSARESPLGCIRPKFMQRSIVLFRLHNDTTQPLTRLHNLVLMEREGIEVQMRRIAFERGSVTGIILTLLDISVVDSEAAPCFTNTAGKCVFMQNFVCRTCRKPITNSSPYRYSRHYSKASFLPRALSSLWVNRVTGSLDVVVSIFLP